MYLDIPVLVKIVNTCDAASIPVRVVNMAHITCPVTWVTGNHGLKTEEIGSLIVHFIPLKTLYAGSQQNNVVLTVHALMTVTYSLSQINCEL